MDDSLAVVAYIIIIRLISDVSTKNYIKVIGICLVSTDTKIPLIADFMVLS